VAGQAQTFPIWVYGAVKVGTPPQVFVLGTFIFAAGVLLAALNLAFQQRKNRSGKIFKARAATGG
jgi:spermidine/putrescine transport system permease protein